MSYKVTDDRAIYKTIGGSKLYGTDGPHSDTDYRTIIIPSLAIEFGALFKFEVEQDHPEIIEGEEKEDADTYGLKKFIQLASQCNPNIIEQIYVPENKIISVSSAFKEILDNRDKFLTKRARWTFSGYAHNQLERIKRHKRWLLNPPDHKPIREEYDLLPNQKMMDKSVLNALRTMSAEQWDFLGLKEEARVYLEKENKYFNAKREWDSYEGWKRKRNPGRAALEAKYGYDTKHAMHLMRLLIMSKEIATGLGYRPDRTGIDAEYLKDIRFNGALSYDNLIIESEKLKADAEAAYELPSCILPQEINKEEVNNMYIQTVLKFYKTTGELD